MVSLSLKYGWDGSGGRGQQGGAEAHQRPRDGTGAAVRGHEKLPGSG